LVAASDPKVEVEGAAPARQLAETEDAHVTALVLTIGSAWRLARRDAALTER
jgi:hypothetical protein